MVLECLGAKCDEIIFPMLLTITADIPYSANFRGLAFSKILRTKDPLAYPYGILKFHNFRGSISTAKIMRLENLALYGNCSCSHPHACIVVHMQSTVYYKTKCIITTIS